jgi:hypothetical protein
MNDEHAQLVAELLAVAKSALERLEPILERAAVPHGSAPEPGAANQWSGCSWCPVCALAALIRGEQHDLVTLLAGQASAVITVLRQVLEEHQSPDVPDPGNPGPPGPGESEPAGGAAPGPSSFSPIAVTIKH